MKIIKLILNKHTRVSACTWFLTITISPFGDIFDVSLSKMPEMPLKGTICPTA